MGVAFGRFHADPDFDSFRETTPPDQGRQRGVDVWTNLVILTSEGIAVESQAVTLACGAFGGEFEAEISVLGVPPDLYAILFPGHLDQYDRSAHSTQ